MDILKRHLSPTCDRDKFNLIQDIKYYGIVRNPKTLISKISKAQNTYRIYSFKLEIINEFEQKQQYEIVVCIFEEPGEGLFWSENIDDIEEERIQETLNSLFEDVFESMTLNQKKKQS